MELAAQEINEMICNDIKTHVHYKIVAVECSQLRTLRVVIQ